MKFGKDGRLYAINPENGFFGVAPGTSSKSNPNALAAVAKNTLFTNVALTDDGDVWWEGMTDKPPSHLIDWLGKDWTPAETKPAAHPNSRFTAPLSQCPTIDPAWDDPNGVPISAIIFGGRRSTTVPLVYQAFNWKHGTFLGASVASEQTAAAEGKLGSLRHDPFAMIPFCGYNMADYFAHWLNIGSKSTEDKLPKIFFVNWFKKSSEGKFMWPGFGENSRVLKWIFDRCDAEGDAQANKTAIGYIPKEGALDVSGLDVSPQVMQELFKLNPAEWLSDIGSMRKFLSQFGEKVPKGITEELDGLEKRISTL
jgi:phosphoenolpyruvate carboxykinase (GTP)